MTKKKIGKGWHSEVFLVEDKVVRKKFKKNLKRNFTKEWLFLNLLQRYNFVPKPVRIIPSELSIDMEFVRGISLRHCINKDLSKDNISRILCTAFLICFFLDTIKLHKEELISPKKDILVCKNGRIVFLDWERSKITSKPGNVTQFSIFIAKIYKKLYGTSLKRITTILSKYKRRYTFQEFFILLKTFFDAHVMLISYLKLNKHLKIYFLKYFLCYCQIKR